MYEFIHSFSFKNTCQFYIRNAYGNFATEKKNFITFFHTFISFLKQLSKLCSINKVCNDIKIYIFASDRRIR